MPIELPTFEEGYGLMLCVCGELQMPNTLPDQQESKLAKYNTEQGEVFIRASIEDDPKRTLCVNCARAEYFRKGQLPKITTDKKEDVLRIIESASSLKLRAIVCGSFRIALEELPESGLIRSLLSEAKAAGASMQMVGASFALTGAPIHFLKWQVAKPREKSSMVDIELRGRNEFQVSDTYLSDVWRWIYEQFTIFVLGTGRDNANPTD